MEQFEASVQYNDWKGSSAADDSDWQGISDHVRQKSLSTDEERVIGVSFFTSDGKSAFVNVYVAPSTKLNGSPNSNDKVRIRKVHLNLSVLDFFKLFKRFHVVLLDKNINIAGRTIEELEDEDTDE